jgi:hypothetical protein
MSDFDRSVTGRLNCTLTFICNKSAYGGWGAPKSLLKGKIFSSLGFDALGGLALVRIALWAQKKN